MKKQSELEKKKVALEKKLERLNTDKEYQIQKGHSIDGVNQLIENCEKQIELLVEEISILENTPEEKQILNENYNDENSGEKEFKDIIDKVRKSKKE